MERIFTPGPICKLEIKDLNLKDRIVQAYYFNAESIDTDYDIIDIGAYDKSITERGPKSAQPRIKHLYNHWEGAGVLQELGKDMKGGWFISKLGRHTIGRDVLLMYEDGLITEHSHGFETINSSVETVEGKEIRRIKEGILWEVTSLDKWGANKNTPVIKSIEDQREWVGRLDKLQKAINRGNYTDDTFEVFEIQIMQIKELLKQFDLELKPYPSEHAARVRDPDDFEKDSFRRKNISEGIDIIIGRLKGETKMTTQAYRFDAEKFTAAQAKKWLKDHDIDYISFEAASKVKEPDQPPIQKWTGGVPTLKNSVGFSVLTIK